MTLTAWASAMFVGIGAVGIAASAPALFFNDPHWLMDNMFRVIERLLQSAG